jgi:hypothetical protein
MSETFRSAGARMNRRVAMGALAAGASALVFGSVGTAAADDDGVWHAISAVGDDGIWYIGNDGYEYLIDGFDSSTEYVV